MRTVIATTLLMIMFGLPARAQEWLQDPFQPGDLTAAEQRIVQAALVAAGRYLGPLDGGWNEESSAALADHAGGGAAPLFADLIPLLDGFDAEWQAGGWQVIHVTPAGISFALPAGILALTEEGGVYVWDGGGLSARLQVGDQTAALAQHERIYDGRAVQADRYQFKNADRLITSVVLENGQNAYARSERSAGGFATLLLLSDDANYSRLALMALSLTPGEMADFALPAGGLLASLYGGPSALKGEKPEGQTEEPPVRRALSPKDAESTGSGFYVNAANIVTAAHVVEGCTAMSLSDGSPVEVVLADDDLDLAVLVPAQGSRTWLNLRPELRPRLGETVYALGYPYLGLLSQGLAVTGGNVSALGGIEAGEVRIMVSAPVQPGNSGGPLVNARGDVVGVVVSRIDDLDIYDQTGTLPQNMNFAVPPAALVAFLERAAVVPAPLEAQDIDIARGLPDEMRDSVVPLFCY